MFALKRFSQQDPRWKDQQMGFAPTATIGNLGCLLTDLAMVVAGFGFEETPASLNHKLKALGPGAGFIGEKVIPGALPRVVPGMIFRDVLFCRDEPAPLDRIDAALAAGWPVIVELDYSPAAQLQSHWVVLIDRQNGDYLLQDPWPFPPDKPVHLSTSRFAFAGGPAEVITAVVWLEGPRLPANKPAGAVSVYATADGLALRLQPVIDPVNLIKRVPLFAELYSLETVEATLQKVGVVHQWLNVQDAEGSRGFAAAWYLNTRREVPNQPPEIPSPEVPLTVYAAADQLALRNQPVVNSATLIKRVAVGSKLIVLDPVDEAAPKIGMLDSWLQVRDAEGSEGFVAAWYVSLTPVTSLGPAAVPALGGTAEVLYVRTTHADVALRSKPVVSPKTLIKWLPSGIDLLVIEPAAEAAKKIGIKDQWLNVRDMAQTEGYIAAWYVK